MLRYKNTILLIMGILAMLSFILLSAYAQTRKATLPVPLAQGSAYVEQMQQLELELSSFRARAKNMPESWLALELAARKHLERARLSGSYQDYAEADALLAKAFEISGEQAGPHMARAALNYSLHRLPLVGADLGLSEKKLLLSDTERSRIVALKADTAFNQGHYAAALQGYEYALLLSKNSTTLFNLAHYYWRTGKFEAAEGYLDQAEQISDDSSEQLSAFFHLHRGLFDLDRGHYDDALEHYLAADKIFSGWWLIQEHIAEIYTLQGKLDAARSIYESVVVSTGNPEFMDALAGIAQMQGKQTEAENWLKQARAAYEKQLLAFPEASYAHALGHYLESSDDANKTLELAEANFALRPNGDAATLLAQVYLKAGQLSQAKKLIQTTLGSPWESAELHATAAFIFTVTGELEQAEQEKEKALALNPYALEALEWLGSL